MSVRLRSVAATVAAAGLLTVGATVLPTAANAAIPAAASHSPIAVSLTKLTPRKALQPGGAAESVILKVTNTTGKAEALRNGQIAVVPQGALGLPAGSVTAKVTPLGHTPATTSRSVFEWPGLVGAFYPKGHQTGTFSLPAHATFAWKISLAAAKSFPLNDNAVRLDAYIAEGNSFSNRSVDIKVGDHHTGGSVYTSVWGSDKVAPGKSAFDWITVTNRTGAPLKGWPVFATTDWVSGAKLDTDVWVGSVTKGHWESYSHALTLPRIANGASYTLKIRVRAVYEAPSFRPSTSWIYVTTSDSSGSPLSASKQLAVLA